MEQLKEQLDNDGKVFAYRLVPTSFESVESGVVQRLKLEQQLRNKTEND